MNLPSGSARNRTGAVPVDPYDVESMSAFDAGLSFPIGALTLWRVQRVFEGTITTPDFLDPVTRGRYADGHYENRQINFTLTIPDSAEPGVPVPVVIGLGLAVRDGMSVDAFYEYLTLARRETSNADSIAASYGGHAHFAGIGLRWQR